MKPSTPRRTSAGQTPAEMPEHPDATDRQIAALLQQAGGAEDAPPAKPLDDATLKRVMNGLRARGAFDVPARVADPAAAPAAAGAPRPGGSAAARAWKPWALPAAFVLAAGAVIWALGGNPTTRSLQPEGHQGKQAVPKAESPAGTQQAFSRNPQADAGALAQRLAALGVAARIEPLGDNHLVRATVPPAAVQPVAAALEREGLDLPVDGQLAVLYVAVQK